MSPKDYSGFSCVSWQALNLSNAKLRPELPSADRAYPNLATHLTMTGKHVYGRKIEQMAQLCGMESSCCLPFLPDDDDPSL